MKYFIFEAPARSANIVDAHPAYDDGKVFSHKDYHKFHQEAKEHHKKQKKKEESKKEKKSKSHPKDKKGKKEKGEKKPRKTVTTQLYGFTIQYHEGFYVFEQIRGGYLWTPDQVEQRL